MWIGLTLPAALIREVTFQQEPTKHQYDWDVATTAGFLERNGLSDKFKINVECNHATLAGHRHASTPA